MTEIPELLYPVTRQVITAQDALRDRIIELEDALRGMVGLIEMMADTDFARRYALSEPLLSTEAYLHAVEALR